LNIPESCKHNQRIKNEPYKTHLAYVKERRTEAEATKILDNAIKKMQGED
jgi:hypothetical protein